MLLTQFIAPALNSVIGGGTLPSRSGGGWKGWRNGKMLLPVRAMPERRPCFINFADRWFEHRAHNAADLRLVINEEDHYVIEILSRLNDWFLRPRMGLRGIRSGKYGSQ